MKYINILVFFKLAGVMLFYFMLVNLGNAANLLVNIQDAKQALLEDSVVYLEALDPRVSAQQQQKSPPKKGFIRQRNKTYIPFVSVFQKGTAVSFVNQDRIKHHVYSFSKAKKFEIKLYSGKPPKSTLFDKLGVVTLGCNIHDHMLAYAYIVNTPFYAISAANGKAVLRNIPNGKYRLKVWHPYLKTGRALEKIITMPLKGNNVFFRLQMKPHWKKILKKRLTARKDNSDDDNYLF